MPVAGRPESGIEIGASQLQAVQGARVKITELGEVRHRQRGIRPWRKGRNVTKEERKGL